MVIWYLITVAVITVKQAVCDPLHRLGGFSLNTRLVSVFTCDTIALFLVDVFILSCVPIQITPGSKASNANLCAGDIILTIEGVPAADMLHCEAQSKIKESTNQLCLTVERL